MLLSFKEKLIKENLSTNTISNYLCSCELYIKKFQTINKKNLILFKNFLLDNYKPKTINLRILGINRYLDYIGKSDLKLKEVKIQQKTYLENVISNADYEYLKSCLLKDNNYMWYFVVRCLAATGARISELVQFKVEHIKLGYFDIYSKGGKIRRIYIAESLRKDCIEWLESISKYSGFIFCNKKGEKITTRGIAHQLKALAKKYNINESVVYPHSFRHLYAKNFLEKYNDISLLADLLGHDSIETTRIYLRKTTQEQQKIIDGIVIW